MGKPFILVSSITYAMKSRDLLFSQGIKSYVERTTRLKEQQGCGYGVYVPNDTDQAERILAEAGIRIIGRAERDDFQ